MVTTCSLGEKLYCHVASLHESGNSLLGGKLAMDSHPIQGSSYTPKRLMRRKPGKAQVVFETILVISSCCFAEEEK